jgi:hypothetical protein
MASDDTLARSSDSRLLPNFGLSIGNSGSVGLSHVIWTGCVVLLNTSRCISVALLGSRRVGIGFDSNMPVTCQNKTVVCILSYVRPVRNLFGLSQKNKSQNCHWCINFVGVLQLVLSLSLSDRMVGVPV